MMRLRDYFTEEELHRLIDASYVQKRIAHENNEPKEEELWAGIQKKIETYVAAEGDLQHVDFLN